MSLLEGKRALVVGVASNRSIAWGIAQAMHREGAELALTYQNERLRDRVEKFATELNSEITIPCDVSTDTEIQKVFERLDDYWDHFDILVHSVAYAPKEQLEGNYLENVTREGFLMAHEISSYSFTALADAARPMMQGRQGAMLTMSYIGAVRAMPNYNVMGVAKASLE
ncbi:MAG: enoyl-[acyl-carrier protein] reductase I, partial [Gammaproteobacteria bacterium]